MTAPVVAGAERAALRSPTPRYSPTFIRWFVRLTYPLFRVWFRPRIEGMDRVPAGASLVVGNHSAFGVLEILLLMCCWYRANGAGRPVVGLSHDLGLSWPLRWGVERIGGVRASHAKAVEALRQQVPVLVFPGGDVDLFRPFSARYEVRWNGRHGFVETALETGAPIVPMAICGSHAQYTMLPGGEKFARLTGLTKRRIHSWSMPVSFVVFLGVTVAAAFGALPAWAGIVALVAWLVPNPSRIEVSFLAPVDARALVAETGTPQAAAEAVRRLVEQRVGELARRRMTPWF